LYRDAVRADRFLTIDRWQNEEDWQSFLHAFGAAYESLDAQLEGLAAPDRHIASAYAGPGREGTARSPTRIRQF